MEDKIKIRVTKEVYDVIRKDCEAFEFLKPNGELNKNAFFTCLINNYYKSYQSKEKELLFLFKSELKLNDEISEMRLVNKLNKLTNCPNKEKYTETISIKPTKDSKDALAFIESFLLNGTTISEFFRNMFASYCLLPQDRREQIIFKPQYEAILKAIQNKKKIFFTTKTSNIKHQEAPYEIATSKEELHCYVLTKYKDNCRAFRLSRIDTVLELTDNAVFNDSDRIIFNKMIKYGPQFEYKVEEKEAKVRLTETGKNLYRRYYVHRPIADRIDGNDYYFSCSHKHLLSYFIRFGKEAFVMEPLELKKQIYKYYKDSFKFYQDQYINEQKNRLK